MDKRLITYFQRKRKKEKEMKTVGDGQKYQENERVTKN